MPGLLSGICRLRVDGRCGTKAQRSPIFLSEGHISPWPSPSKGGTGRGHEKTSTIPDFFHAYHATSHLSDST